MSGATAVSVKERLVRSEVGCKWELVASGEGKGDWAKEVIIPKAQLFLSSKVGSGGENINV